MLVTLEAKTEVTGGRVVAPCSEMFGTEFNYRKGRLLGALTYSPVEITSAFFTYEAMVHCEESKLQSVEDANLVKDTAEMMLDGLLA